MSGDIVQLEIECVIWCPRCKEARFNVRRQRTAREGVYVHIHEPLHGAENHRFCDKCGGLLERTQ